jgi:hypothetical protein
MANMHDNHTFTRLDGNPLTVRNRREEKRREEKRREEKRT